jgi:hypothetical protein
MTMPKKSTAKPTAKPIPVKTPKTRINKGQKELLLGYMEKQFDSRIDDADLNQVTEALLKATNALLREKYPEADMPVLRKYKLTRVDTNLNFNRNETGRFFRLRFGAVQEIETRLADIVHTYYRNDVFPCDAAFEVLADKWEKAVSDRAVLVSNKRAEYRGFLEACRYLEEVEQIVPLSDEIRKALEAQSRSLTVISPDILSRIRSDFAIAA